MTNEAQYTKQGFHFASLAFEALAESFEETYDLHDMLMVEEIIRILRLLSESNEEWSNSL